MLTPSASSLALFTDLYQLTMAYGYWKARVTDREAVFHHYFRANPFGGGYAVCCGLHDAIDFLKQLQFSEDDVAYLATLPGNDKKPLFDDEFLDFLRDFKWGCDLDAIPEGTVVFANEPLLRVQGPILHCQIVETALLNILNFQTMIATKAARVCHAAGAEPVLEFGMRRAQGIDGALSASRAAYIGGCAATSNLLAGKLFGIPVAGTHAHSWVMLFDSELDSFKAYARALPNNCSLLVDTYNTLQGVQHALQIGQWLRPLGHRLAGIRLDSGDLAYLSIEARRLLDAANLKDVPIIASNQLDETIIASLKSQGAKIAIWGVGTELVTGGTQAALGGIYKLSAVREPRGPWQPRLKISEQNAKISFPGIQQVRRFLTESGPLADAIYDIDTPAEGAWTIIDPMDATNRKTVPAATPYIDLLVPIFRHGKCIYDAPAIHTTRERAARGLTAFHGSIKRFVNPHLYPVGLESSLHQTRTELILKARNRS
jgi:nicotinate phosphoribosyltransferase